MSTSEEKTFASLVKNDFSNFFLLKSCIGINESIGYY